MSDPDYQFLDFVFFTPEVMESPAVKAAMETMSKMEAAEVVRPGGTGPETVRIEDMTDDERALLLGMLVRMHREKLS